MQLLKKILLILRSPWHDRLNLLGGVFVLFKTAVYYRHVFAFVGHRCRIYKPLLLANPRFVMIGDRTIIRSGARIEAILLDQEHPPSLTIGKNVNIEQNVHIVCSSKLVIGDDVTITGNCAIVDTVHPFRDVNDPTKIGERIDPMPTPVEIGQNTFIGFGSVILPNVRIGAHCVIGANCTVTRDVPDYCVVAGNPASIVLRYDFQTNAWI